MGNQTLGWCSLQNLPVLVYVFERRYARTLSSWLLYSLIMALINGLSRDLFSRLSLCDCKLIHLEHTLKNGQNLGLPV